MTRQSVVVLVLVWFAGCGDDFNAARRPDYDTTIRIDDVFVAGADWTVPEWVVDLWTYGDDTLPVSDHWAIAADLSLP